MTNKTSQGRALAWVALLVAMAASVAANVASAHDQVGPRLSAGIAPVLVLLSAGLLERVPLAGVVLWRRALAYAGLASVASAAFTTSFLHQYELLLAYGNPRLSAVLLPVAVDGQVVLASICLAVIAERRTDLRAGGLSLRAIGAVTGAAEPTVRRDLATASFSKGNDAVVERITGLDGKSRPAARSEPEPAAAEAGRPAPARKGSTSSRGIRHTRAEPAPARRGSTAQRVTALRQRHPDMPAGDIARRIGVTKRTVQRHLAASDTSSDTGVTGDMVELAGSRPASGRLGQGAR